MNMNYRYIFDLDNTLVMTNKLNNISYNYALGQFDMEAIEGVPRITRNTILAIYPNLSATKSEEIIAIKQRYFVKNVHLTSPNEGLISMLKSKDPNHCILWTSAEDTRVSSLLKYYDMEHKFAYILHSNKLNITPDVHKMCAILSCKLTSLLFFEDDEKVVDELKALNLMVIKSRH